MRWALYGIAAFLALGAILSIASVGKPRKPLTGGTAVIVAVVNAAFITVLVIAAGML